MYCVDLVVADGLISILSLSFLSRKGFDRVVGVFGCICCLGISLVRRKGIFCVLVFACRRLMVSFLLENSFLYLMRTSSCFFGFLFWVLREGSFLVVEAISGSLMSENGG